MKVKQNKGIKVRIFPTDDQEAVIRTNFMWARQFYNYLVDWQTEHNKRIHKLKEQLGDDNVKEKMILSKFDYIKMVAPYRKNNPGAKQADSQNLSAVAVSFWQAWKNYYNPKMIVANKPTKHSWVQRYSGRYVDNFNYSATKAYVKVPGFSKTGKGNLKGMIRFSGGQSLKNIKPKRFTITEDYTGKFYLSLIIEYTLKIAPVEPKNVVGIDLGMHSVVNLSDGTKYKHINYRRLGQSKLAPVSRKFSRRLALVKKAIREDKHKNLPIIRQRKDFANYVAIKHNQANHHKHMANQRKNYLHNLTREIVNKYDAVIVEDIKSDFMFHSGKGLALNAYDASWGALTTMLEYKCHDAGKLFLKVDKDYTSQICSDCGYKYSWLGCKTKSEYRGKTSWVCPKCGASHDRDINAARNVRARGLEEISKITLQG